MLTSTHSTPQPEHLPDKTPAHLTGWAATAILVANKWLLLMKSCQALIPCKCNLGLFVSMLNTEWAK